MKSSSSNGSGSNGSVFDYRNATSTPINPKHGKTDEMKSRRRSDINSWAPEPPGTRVKRSDSNTSSEQFPVKTTTKKISPQIGRRRSSVETAKSAPNPSGISTAGVVMRKPRNKNARPRSMLVESNTKKEFGKQMKNVYHSDDENDNLFSKMKQRFKQKRSTPDQSAEQTKPYSPDLYSLDKSPSQLYKKTPLLTSTQNNKPPLSHTYITTPTKKSPPPPPPAHHHNGVTLTKQSPSQRHLSTSDSPPQRHGPMKSQLRDMSREFDIGALEDVDMDSFIANQNANRLYRVANEIEDVINTQKYSNSSSNNISNNSNNSNNTLNGHKCDGSYTRAQQILSRTPPERDVPIKSVCRIYVYIFIFIGLNL